ncbi:MAG TPA: hypothetical protein VFY31_07190 [Macromonas sp.]|nr:hypothetical protein [Macromonas sp.]
MDKPNPFAEQARRAAAKRLQAAAQFAQFHAAEKPLFSKRMGKGKSAVIVRLDWPGVLTVTDPDTGHALAVSEPGHPAVLAGQYGDGAKA